MEIQRRRGIPERDEAVPSQEGEAAPSHDEFVRAEVVRMLDSDWTNAELQAVGVTRELAAELGIRHPRFGHFDG